MLTWFRSVIGAGCFFACVSVAQAEISDSIHISGFGSIIGATVSDGPGYIAEYPNVATYDDDGFDFGPETKLGIQITGSINEKFSATTQFMIRGANDYDPEVAWAYLTFQVSDQGTLQGGRLRVPVYHFSEFMDVGYAYPWLRIPSDAYSLDLINYNGVRYSHQFYLGNTTLEVMGIYGNQTNNDDELMSYLFPQQIDREFEDIMGLVLNFDMDNIVLRTSYVKSDMRDTRHLSEFLATQILGIPGDALYPSNTGLTDGDGDSLVATDTYYDISFFDVSAKVTFGNVNLFAEYNKYKPFYSSYFGSISYTLNEYEIYALYSKFDLDEPWESHDTQSVGVRYDFMPNVAFKFDVSRFDDTGFNPFTLEPNPVYAPAKLINGGDGDGDATIVSVGLDFVF